jgi:hypothetical protein
VRSFLVTKNLLPLSGGVASVNGEGPIGLKWGFFFSPFRLFSLSFPRNLHLTFKKQLCPPVCDLIDFGPPFDHCLYGF